jgi:hypothetical protein
MKRLILLTMLAAAAVAQADTITFRGVITDVYQYGWGDHPPPTDTIPNVSRFRGEADFDRAHTFLSIQVFIESGHSGNASWPHPNSMDEVGLGEIAGGFSVYAYMGGGPEIFGGTDNSFGLKYGTGVNEFSAVSFCSSCGDGGGDAYTAAYGHVTRFNVTVPDTGSSLLLLSLGLGALLLIGMRKDKKETAGILWGWANE